MNNIETKWLYDFLTLEECRNFSHAAEQRNLSQSALSRRIQALEIALGVELFDRNRLPLELTEQGRLFHSQARSLLQQFECNISELTAVSMKAAPNIKIAAAHSLSFISLPGLLKAMSLPDDRFICHVESIDVDQAVDKLKEGKSDFILSFHDERLLQPPFKSIKIFQSVLYPVCATDKAGKALFDVENTNVPFLSYTNACYLGRLVNRCLAENSHLSLQTLFISSMSELLKNMALQGFGIAWLPYYAIEEEVKNKQLVYFDKPGLVIPIQAYMYRVDTRLNTLTEQFWQRLKQGVF